MEVDRRTIYDSLPVCPIFAASAQIGSGVDHLVALGANRTLSALILTLFCIAVVVGGMRNLLAVSEKSCLS